MSTTTYLIMIAYMFVSGLIVGSLLTDRNVARSMSDRVICVMAGILWPGLFLLLFIALGFERFDKRRKDREHEHVVHMLQFLVALNKLDLISPSTFGLTRMHLSLYWKTRNHDHTNKRSIC